MTGAVAEKEVGRLRMDNSRGESLVKGGVHQADDGEVLAQGYPKGKAGAVVEIVRTITQGPTLNMGRVVQLAMEEGWRGS